MIGQRDHERALDKVSLAEWAFRVGFVPSREISTAARWQEIREARAATVGRRVGRSRFERGPHR
jgi:hypothetical protein